ncbi:50S ribosomal protein L10 [Candidatus Parcubacteria bacterium]|nr:50S ribosomal protein L10 [Candidatus Parcubacteria bacterium]
MAKSKAQKQEILTALADKIDRAKSVVFTKFDALEVKDNEALRNKLRENNSEYFVAKKTLLDIAFRDKKIENLNIKDFDGKVSAVFGYEDEVAPAKVVNDFREDNRKEDNISFVGAILEGKFLKIEEVEALAKLPSKQELYAKMVGSLNAPVSGFVNVLAGNLRGLVNVLKAIEEKK